MATVPSLEINNKEAPNMVTNISNPKQEQNNNSSLKNSYVGKKVFVGIDVHKRTYSVVTVVEGVVIKKWRTVASPEKLVQTTD